MYKLFCVLCILIIKEIEYVAGMNITQWLPEDRQVENRWFQVTAVAVSSALA